jgi:hypothetical protein
MLRKLLLAIVPHIPAHRVIPNREGDGDYLSRWYLLRKEAPKNSKEAEKEMGVKTKPDLYLHRFHRSDDGEMLHNHPWEWSLSFVLVGGYREERRIGDKVIYRSVLPFRFNFIRGDDYHRVDLYEEDAWSLFLVGPRVTTWYFWDRVRKARLRWELFLDKKNTYEWEPDSREG